MVKRTPPHKKKGSKRKVVNYDIDGFNLLRGQTLEDLIKDVKSIEKKFK